MNTIIISPEREEDFSHIDTLLSLGYRRESESNFVNQIRGTEDYIPQLALTAYIDDILVGYILLPRVSLRTANEVIPLLTILPFAVHPSYRSKGIGKMLLKESLNGAERKDYGAVVTMNCGKYFKEFGFLPAREEYGLEIQFKISEDDFRALELAENALYRKSGFLLSSAIFNLVLR